MIIIIMNEKNNNGTIIGIICCLHVITFLYQLFIFVDQR